MKVNIKLKKANLEKLIRNMVVLVDSREDKNKPIIQYLQKNNIPFVIRKLDFGDYSCMIQKNEELGLPFDISLEKNIAIECKQNLEEISGNLTQSRERFENEFMRAKEKGCEMYLVIEKGSWKDIYKHNYNTKYNEKSFYNSLLSFSKKYDLKIHFVDNEISCIHILRILQTELKKFLEE
jgi:ERCC4-type nuclease